MGPWLGVAALGYWAANPGGIPLLIASVGLLAGLFLSDGRRSRLAAWGSVLLLGGILAGFGAHRQVASLSQNWDAYWSEREASVGERLDAALEARLQAAEAATAAVAAMAADSVPATAGPLNRIRRQHQVSALALYGPEGDLQAWDGVHRGRVPEEVQQGFRRYAYGDLPLFGYLYVTAPTGAGGTVVAAVLLRADLPGALASDAGDFATDFRHEVGEPIRLEASSVGGSPGWDWTLGDRTLFTVALDPPTREARSAAVLAGWRVRVAGAGVLAWFLLALGGVPRRRSAVGASLVLVFLAAVLPFALLDGVAGLFDPAGFTLPGPFPLTLGRVAVLALALVPLVAAIPSPQRRLSPLLGGALVAVAAPAWLTWVGHGPSPEALAEWPAAWLVYQGTVAVVLTLMVGVALTACGGRDSGYHPRGWLALPVAALLGAGAAVWVGWMGFVPLWWAALWGIPVALSAAWGAPWPGARGPLAVWLAAGILASTAAVPASWAHRVEARRAIAESYLERLAAPDDPELEDALRRLGDAASSQAAQGKSGVDLLYGAWRASGLADLGAPAWITLWTSAGIPEKELRVGVVDRPVVSYDVQDDPLGVTGSRIIPYDRDDARYVLRASLPGGSILTAAAPPFVDPAFRAGLSPLLGGGSREERHPITLVPLAAWEGSSDQLQWRRSPIGWQAELPLSFSNALYIAHYAVPLPGAILGTARATLLLFINVTLFLVFWGVGRGLLRPLLPRTPRWSDVVVSFRARVTLALFGFFVLAIALFGTLAYRTIAGTSWRAAQVVAERVAEDAAGWYVEVSGRMQALSRRVGVELLEYRGGELRDGSVEELVDLGLYEGWVPMSVFRTLEEREDVLEVTQSELGSWDYVSAYRRLPDGDMITAQVPRQAGATAIRSADVLELLAFAVLLGAALSLALALLVARALTSPIHALQVASERVGAGNLALRLPGDRSDEFGAVFKAFNRMVGRLRRARRQLERTTRRTKAIMEEAAVGMVALDPGGRVTLVNPRVGALLGVDVVVGEPVPAVGRAGEELAQWLDTFLRSKRQEHGFELQDGARRIRVRARRLGTEPTLGGAVVAVEDVTDELHTERVLAWGEMARQVAHEVKNPLTPMKLSVQHVRRAWEDGRPDFQDILFRNGDTILQEIDRLAAIAKSFSRFGAPYEGGELPLESVDLARVVDDVLALYRGSEGPVTFEADVSAGLPQVQARVSEMKEVLVNLLENARVASPDGGLVRVEGALSDLGGLLLHVVDTGRGVPEAIKARVFEPQFSTRSTGAGLGLAIVQRLVESWGGTVGLEEGARGGTRVTLRLRVSSADGEAGSTKG